jgi:hypothetical protein
MNKNQNKNLKFNSKPKHFYFKKKKSIYLKSIDRKKKEETRPIYPNNYLYKNKKLKRGIFLKKPTLYEILYPVFLNLKLIKQYLKKK